MLLLSLCDHLKKIPMPVWTLHRQPNKEFVQLMLSLSFSYSQIDNIKRHVLTVLYLIIFSNVSFTNEPIQLVLSFN